MTVKLHTGRWIIVLSFLIAFLLGGVPLPDSLERFRPDWVAMVLIYWNMALPHRVGIGIGWLVGLLMDVGRGGLLGPDPPAIPGLGPPAPPTTPP
ncbi:MAG TPA: rod shape-determining protein MreD, partial [Candidatus Competibacter sp.]|nr:rod shape-determining protein MreD [Candidatus Competibacter sp.]